MNFVLKFLSFSTLSIIISSLSSVGEQASAATLIDFENGFVDFQSVSTVLTVDNQATFSVGSGLTGGTSPAFIAGVGGPVTAFSPNDGMGTPGEPVIGNFILTAQPAGTTNFSGANYFIEFENPVTSLSLDLLDFLDGGASVGDTATLTAFSDTFLTTLTSDIFTITSGLPDGNLETLFVEASDTPIRSASLVFSTFDLGVAIDNISFETTQTQTETVPEPQSIVGAVVALAFGMAFNRVGSSGRS